MSDFLSNFSEKKYQETRASRHQANVGEKPVDAEAEKLLTAEENQQEGQQEAQKEAQAELQTEKLAPELPEGAATEAERESTPFTTAEYTEKDPSYQKKQRRKQLYWGLGAVVVLVLVIFGYRQMNYVLVPDFKGKELSSVRQWATEQRIEVRIKQVYDEKSETNRIVNQSLSKQKIKKGKIMTVTASLGPNPDKKLPLLDFKEMTLAETKKWITKNKAENLAIIEEYSETIAKGAFLKSEFAKKDGDATTYKRRDKLTLYYSKGKEVYEKNIAVPDFLGKGQEEVEEWAKKNEVRLKIEETTSETVAVAKVMAQMPAKETKIAKKETFSITVSSGKAIIVPNFAESTMEEAETVANGLQVQVRQQFSQNLAYGQLIEQSVAAGQRYTEKEEKPTIVVTYSIGQPYLKDLRNTAVEGDLQKIFYEEYQVKKAAIRYQIYYVDSSVTKGTVVEMSRYNEYVPLNSVIKIGISRGNLPGADLSEAKAKESAETAEKE